MGIKIKIKKRLDEMSSVSGGAIQGYGAPFGTPKGIDAFNKKEAEEQRLKGERLDEMFSSSGLSGRNRRPLVSGEDEHAGHVERSRHQGLKNVMQEDDDATFDLGDDSFEDTFSDEPDTADALSSASSKPQTIDDIVLDQLEKKGFELGKKLGEGAYGRVYAGESHETGLDCAIKVVGLGSRSIPREAIVKEINVYKKTSDAREKHDAIWRHFPEVYESWIYDDEDGLGYVLGFIIMEKLVPATNEEKAFIPDLFSILATRHPMDIEDVKGNYKIKKDLSKRAAFWARDLNHVTKVFDMYDDLMRRNEPIDSSDKEEYQQILSSVSQSALKRYERMADNAPDKIKRLIKDRMRKLGYWAFDFEWLDGRDALENDLGANSYIKLIWADLIYAVARIGYMTNTPESQINQMVKEMSAEVINGYRKGTGFPVSFRYGGELYQTNTEREKEMAPARDLYKAMQALYKVTGLLAKDMHDDNVMKREGSNDLVISDMGLFKQLSIPKDLNITEVRKYRIKLLTKPKK